MPISFQRAAWLGMLISLLLGSKLQSQDAAETAKIQAAKQFEYLGCLADRFEAKLVSGVPLKRSHSPILNWTIDSSWQGSIYVWTCDDRPALVGCFLADTTFPYERRVFAEMHAMTDEPLAPIPFAGVRNYEWNPANKTNSRVEVADLPLPAENERLRGSQLRELAAQFQVTMYEEATRGTGKEELRMLPRPLYRYPGSAARDGAIFAFVTSRGTDPEFLLAIECDPKRIRDGWSIRPMRFCTRRLDLRRGEKLVWSIGEYVFPDSENVANSPTVKITEPYTIITLLKTPTKDFEEIRTRTLAEAKK